MNWNLLDQMKHFGRIFKNDRPIILIKRFRSIDAYEIPVLPPATSQPVIEPEDCYDEKCSIMGSCRCFSPPFHFSDYKTRYLGVDESDGSYADVELETCKHCGAKWLRYFMEIEGISRSGRWYRGLLSEKEAARASLGDAIHLLSLKRILFEGGSFYDSTGRLSAGKLELF